VTLSHSPILKESFAKKLTGRAVHGRDHVGIEAARERPLAVLGGVVRLADRVEDLRALASTPCAPLPALTPGPR
jgi:hypothetical protein